MSEKGFNDVFSKRLRYYLNDNGITQAELAKKLGVGTTSVYNWCNGIKTPRMDKVDAMCEIFHCKRSDLIVDDTPKTTPRRKGVRIPVLGRVAAGIPIEAIEDVINYEEITEDMAKTGEFFGLVIKGDSMNPKIDEGDIVIVRQQDDAESGDTIIATVNGTDATCKRLKKYAGGIMLLSLNSQYEPMVYTDEEIENMPVKIIGKVVELRAKF